LDKSDKKQTKDELNMKSRTNWQELNKHSGRFSSDLSLEEERVKTQYILEKIQCMAQLGHFEVDIERDSLLWSRQLRKIYGLNPNETLTKAEVLFTKTHPDDLSRVIKLMEDCMANKTPFNFEKRIIHESGAIRILRCTGEIICDEAGNARKVLGVSQDVTDIKQAESAVILAEEKYKQLIENLTDLVFSVGKDGLVIYISPAIKKYGYLPQEVLGTRFSDYLFAEDLSTVNHSFRDVLQGKNQEEEYRVLTKNGEIRWVSSHSRAIYENGVAIGITGIIHDITEQKRQEEAAQSREAFRISQNEMLIKLARKKIIGGGQLHETVKQICEMAAETIKMQRVNIWLYDNDGNLGYFEGFDIHSAAAPDNKLTINSCPNFFKALRKESVIDASDALTDSKTSCLAEIYLNQYNIKSIMCAQINLAANLMGIISFESIDAYHTWKIEEIHFASSIADLSSLVIEVEKRQQAEKHAEISEQKFRTFFEDSRDMIFICEPTHSLQEINKAGCKLLGYKRKELLGRNLQDFCANNLQLSNLTKEITKKGSIRNFEIQAYTKQREIKTCQITASIRRDKTGKITSCLGTVRDITEKKNLQAELERAKRLEAAGRLAGQIAHDFNNLLSPLAAYPPLIADQLPPDHFALEMLEEMQFTTNKIAEINQQLLTLGRRGHYRAQKINLNSLVKKEIATQKIPKGISLNMELCENLMLTNCGEAQLGRACLNLLKNAIEAMNESGKLKIKTENIYLDKPLVGYKTIERGEYVKLTISDTGPGISKLVLDKIYDPFFSTKEMNQERGTGLGLSVVHGVVEDNHGYISLETRAGKGTSFSVFLPATREIDQPDFEKSDNQPSTGGLILAVDDDPLQRRVLRQVLSHAGYDVHCVKNGGQAVHFVTENKPDLVILDMILDGIDGTETYKKILDINPGQKAILLSGYAQSIRVKTAIEMGAHCFLPKPIIPKKIIDTIREALTSKIQGI